MKEDDKEFCRIVGKVIRKLRIQKGAQSLCAFAAKNDIPSSTLSRIEVGENEAQLHTLKKIVDGLGITLSDLFLSVEQNLQK